MVAGGATDATTNILDGTGTGEANDITSTHTRLYYHHLKKICMPFIEWTCVAGIPTLLCIKIIGLPPAIWSKLLLVKATVDVAGETSRICGIPVLLCIKIVCLPPKIWSKLLSVKATVDGVGGTSNTTCGSIDSDYLPQWTLPALVITSVLSLIAILLFGDSPGYGNDHANSRGMGIVTGSHLIPLLYLAVQLSVLCGDETNDSCSVENQDCETHISAGRGLNHLRFASLGGLAFAISYIWSQYNHRKYNCKRRKGDIGAVQIGDATNRNGVNKGKDAQSEYSISAMSICWKIYLLLMIFHSTIQALSSDYDVCTLLLGMLHILLIHHYVRKTAILTQDDRTIQGAWQDAFTPGEWMAVSTLITSLVGEYILEYSGITCNSKSGVLALYSPLPLHLTVAHAGVLGCLVGVALLSFLKKSLPNSILYQCTDFVRGNITRKLGMIVSLITVTGITFGCIEVAMNSRLDTDFNLSMILSDYIPRSVEWLLHFLSSKLVIAMPGSTIGVLRVVVLGYWACILAVCLPATSMITSWITAGKASNVVDANMNNGAIDDHIYKHNTKERKKRVIIARKYFHLVAILLFTPITWLDPDMMTLSYAIATALLILLEMVRGWISTDDNNDKTSAVRNTDGTSWNQFMAFLDEKDSSAAKGGLAVTHIALIVGCAFPLWVNQLLQQTYMSSAADTLSSQSPSGTLFYSDEILLPLLPFLGVLVLGIGDSSGAICGMKFGRHRWPGGSSRTLEGSLCMFLSMMLVIFGACVFIASTNDATYQCSSDIANDAIYYMLQASVPLGMITLIEASTAQIDNLCLPIAGSTLMLLMTAWVGEIESR